MSFHDEPQRVMNDGVYAVVNEDLRNLRKGDAVRVVDGRDVHGGERVLVYSMRRRDRYWVRAAGLMQIAGEGTA